MNKIVKWSLIVSAVMIVLIVIGSIVEPKKESITNDTTSFESGSTTNSTANSSQSEATTPAPRKGLGRSLNQVKSQLTSLEWKPVSNGVGFEVGGLAAVALGPEENVEQVVIYQKIQTGLSEAQMQVIARLIANASTSNLAAAIMKDISEKASNGGTDGKFQDSRFVVEYAIDRSSATLLYTISAR